MDTEILKDVGLTENEIAVFIAGTKQGIAGASQISKIAKIPRTTVNDALNSLIGKGLSSYVRKGKIRQYSMVDPKELLERLKEKENRLKKIIPELEQLRKITAEKPEVEFYQGSEGFKTAANNILKENIKEYKAYIAKKNLDFLPYFHAQYKRIRQEKNMHVKVLTEKSEQTQQMKNADFKENRETRFLDPVLKDALVSSFIYADKLAYIIGTEKEQSGIIIKNKEIAQVQEKIFDLLWEISKN